MRINRLHVETLDLDYNDKLMLSRVLNKICICKHLKTITIKFSQHKGTHVLLYCDIECYMCRFLYDDFRRFAFDQTRPQYARNILFDVKNKIPKHTIIVRGENRT